MRLGLKQEQLIELLDGGYEVDADYGGDKVKKIRQGERELPLLTKKFKDTSVYQLIYQHRLLDWSNNHRSVALSGSGRSYLARIKEKAARRGNVL